MSLKMNKQTGLSFSFKLSIFYALFFIISSLALFGTAYYFINNLIAQQEQEVIYDRIQEYKAWYAEGGIDAVKIRFNKQPNREKDIFFVRIIGPSKTVLFLSIPKNSGKFNFNKISSANPANPTNTNNEDSWFSLNRYGKDYWNIGSTRLSYKYILQVGKNSTESHEFLEHFKSIFFIFVIPIMLIGIISGILFTYHAMYPIRKIIQTVRNILDTNKRNTRVKARSNRGELNELVALFNQMLDKNESLINSMHDSLDNVAHDLRTPITRLRGVAELAMQNSQNSKNLLDNKNRCFDALADCMEESERVINILTTLMDVAEAETGSMRLNRIQIPVKKIIKSIIDLYEIVADERNIKIVINITDELTIFIDRLKAQQVFGNLLDNAIKYSANGEIIKITGWEKNSCTFISIQDNGIGISYGEIDKIWDRLYRGDRSRVERGLGLGLSFVKAIIKAHNGTATVKSEINKGSTFIIMLPQ